MFRYRALLSWGVAVGLFCTPVAIHADTSVTTSTRAACLADIEALPSFLLANDTGAKDELAMYGQLHFELAMEKAKKDAAKINNDDSCIDVISTYLKAWRRGHLRAFATSDRVFQPAKPSAATPSDSRNPSLQILSSKTLLLRVPSFAWAYRAPLLDLLAKHHAELAEHPYWIIDVAKNDGGADSTYEPLLDWIAADQIADWSVQWFVTQANLEGHKRLCALLAPGDKECEKFVAETLKRFEGAADQSYVQQDPEHIVSYRRTDHLEPKRPAKIAVLISSACRSSCEEFVLSVRQSYTVKLIGEHTFGTLDYSNLRPHTLPSGRRVLMYATSRSNRLPGMPVDATGILPDVYMPEIADESKYDSVVACVKNWLETGNMEP